MKKPKKPIVISVGGALIVPDGGINTQFLTALDKIIRRGVKKGHKYFLVAGGGRTARQYRDAGHEVKKSMTDHDLDWLGIHASRLNGHLLRTLFVDIAHPRMIENYYHRLENWVEPVVIGAGWKPGHSTDYDAVFLAKEYGADTVINLSNIDYVYDSDPNKNKRALPLKNISWDRMIELVGEKWIPGMNAPFDPIACQLAKQNNLRVIVTDGNDVKNFENILNGKQFTGTVIS